jgi:hypothetical protein
MVNSAVLNNNNMLLTLSEKHHTVDHDNLLWTFMVAFLIKYAKPLTFWNMV